MFVTGQGKWVGVLRLLTVISLLEYFEERQSLLDAAKLISLHLVPEGGFQERYVLVI